MAKKNAVTPADETKKSILEDADRLANALENLADVAEGLRGSRLKEKAVLVLLSAYTKLPQKTISEVLDGLVNIRKAYLK